MTHSLSLDLRVMALERQLRATRQLARFAIVLTACSYILLVAYMVL
ncbi:MAG TPA: hypothetical protein VK741_25750 [Acetobacteraceae bacterium]|jgi:hypothetical protein|nr:hypothetical protein [Acetobacteraceae bacterium]